MGDHELPGDSSVMSVAQALRAAYHGAGQPSRWEGNHEIIWAVCNKSSVTSSVSLGDPKISDYKSLLFEVQQAYMPLKVGVLPRTGDMRKPQDVPTDERRRALKDSWVCNPLTTSLSALIDQGNVEVQVLQEEFQSALQSTFAAASAKVGKQAPVWSQLKAKGRLASVQWETPACQGPRIPNGNVAARKQRRLLARLFDYQRIASRRAEGTASEKEFRDFESLSQFLGSPSAQATRDLCCDATPQLRRQPGPSGFSLAPLRLAGGSKLRTTRTSTALVLLVMMSRLLDPSLLWRAPLLSIATGKSFCFAWTAADLVWTAARKPCLPPLSSLIRKSCCPSLQAWTSLPRPARVGVLARLTAGPVVTSSTCLKKFLKPLPRLQTDGLITGLCRPGSVSAGWSACLNLVVSTKWCPLTAPAHYGHEQLMEAVGVHALSL